MGGADRTTDPTGVVWLPMVHLNTPDLTIAITVDELKPEGIHMGVGISVRTTAPKSNSTLAMPLFLAHREKGCKCHDSLFAWLAGWAHSNLHLDYHR